ncbi:MULTISPECIES: DUF4097 family beta strand repeat-containing protein [unclassified Pseudoclavibacter]|uniref:DUF4097 family beta strand repeat-containing protein n=1 Tax=unclassified Pseudoclavibacter TaxID=2615177 RepID=UPI001BA56A13|nr:DUF4097 family beta strand repeat-containing protein [Pseudoclavibacter sp. Marseille-Q4354]MBS3179583.1 DUF4097 family beta strand repeat protein [Pseudoclavibacter sp. Marseille-Q4354]
MTTPMLEPDTRPEAQGDSTKRFGWITITVAIVGGMVVAGTLTSAVFNSLRDVMRDETTITESVAGVSSLRVDVDSVGIEIEFGDVSEAQLAVETKGFKQAGDWQLTTEGGELTVERAGGRSGGPFGDEELSLTLPRTLSGEDLDAHITVSSGAASLEGDFGDLVIETNSGASNFEGSAANLTVSTGSGATNIEAEVSGDVVLAANSGAVNAVFTGSAPKGTDISLESGFGSVALPDGAYKVESNLSESGMANVNVRQSDDAESTLSVSVGSGFLTVE